MKKIILLLFGLFLTINAQTIPGRFRIGSSDRSGSCTPNGSLVYNTTNGKSFNCSNSAWVQGVGTPPQTFADFQFTGTPTFNCVIGDIGFQTNATPGNNLWLCSSTNTWSQLTGVTGPAGPTGSFGGSVVLYTATKTLTNTDCGNFPTFNGLNLTVILANPPPSSICAFTIKNLNSSSLIISRNSLTINGVANNITLLQGDSISIITDGTNYFTGFYPLVAGTNVTFTPGLTGTTVSVAGAVGPTGLQGPAGPAPSGTGYVSVTGGTLDVPWAPAIVASTSQSFTTATLTDVTGFSWILKAGVTYKYSCLFQFNPTPINGGIKTQIIFTGSTSSDIITQTLFSGGTLIAQVSGEGNDFGTGYTGGQTILIIDGIIQPITDLNPFKFQLSESIASGTLTLKKGSGCFILRQ
jgi:hypothetical protein